MLDGKVAGYRWTEAVAVSIVGPKARELQSCKVEWIERIERSDVLGNGPTTRASRTK